MATLQQLDMNILLWIQEHLRVDVLTPFWRAVTFLGNGGWFWIVLARPRPVDTYTQIIPLITRPKDYSFPSGHTCASFAVALVCLQMLPGKWGILPVVLAGMIAFSRLYLGVHYPGDVLAGFLVALLTSTVACRLMRRTFSPQKS